MASVSWLGLHSPSAIPYLLEAGILSAEPTPDQYTWTTNTLPGDDTQDEELFVTKDCAVVSCGGIVRRVFCLGIEGQPVVQAIIAWFPSTGDDGQVKSDGGYPLRVGTPQALGNGHLGGRHLQGWSSRAQSYSATSNDRKVNREDTPEKQPQQAGQLPSRLSQALVVALQTQIHIYYFSGTNHVVHLPFQVDSILPATQGIIVKRRFLLARHTVSALPVNPPNSFAHSFVESWSAPSQQLASQQHVSQAGISATPEKLLGDSQPSRRAQVNTSFTEQPEMPCFYSLSDPLTEPALVRTIDGPGAKSLATGSRSSGLNPLPSDEELVYVTSSTELANVAATWGRGTSLALAITFNARTDSYTVWSVVSTDSRPLSATKKKKMRDPSVSAILSRRQSSLAPGAATSRPETGTSTPIAYHANNQRESLGAGTRNQNMQLHSSLHGSMMDRQDDKHHKETSQLATSLDLDPDAEMLPSKQARRVSSLLARADLASSQSKLPFSDVSVGNLASFTNARREPSFGGPRTRRSHARSGRSSFQTAFTSASTPPASENGSIYGEGDEPLDDVPWVGDGDGVGTTSRAVTGSAGAFVLRKIDSVSVDSSHGGSERLPAEPRVFTIVPPQNAATISNNSSSFLVCIVHHQKRPAAVLNLSFTLERRRKSTKPWQHDKRGDHALPDSHQPPVIRLAGVARVGFPVTDAVKIVDRGISRIVVLQSGIPGQRLTVLDTDGRPCIKVPLPKSPLPIHHGLLGLPRPPTKKGKSSLNEPHRGTGSLSGFSHNASRGTVSLVGAQQKTYRLQIQLRPHDTQIATMLDVCMLVLPGEDGEGILTTWWTVLRWLQDRGEYNAHREWMALVVTLMSMAVPFLSDSDATVSRRVSKRTGRVTRSVSGTAPANSWNETLQHECHTTPYPEWVNEEGWDWCLESKNQHGGDASTMTRTRTRSSDTTSLASSTQSPSWMRNTFLQECETLTRHFLSSDEGAAVTRNIPDRPGYLPTAPGRDPQLQRTALPTILVALHLYREDLKLGITTSETKRTGAGRLTALLAQLGAWLGWEAWSWRETGYYSTEDATMDRWIFNEGNVPRSTTVCLGSPNLGSITQLDVPPQQFEPPSISDIMTSLIRRCCVSQ